MSLALLGCGKRAVVAAGGPTTITWQNLTGTVDSGGGTLTSNGASYNWQGSSVQEIASGDGYVEWTWDGKVHVCGMDTGALGLNNGNNSGEPVFAFRANTATSGEIFLNGGYKADVSGITSGSVFRFEISGADVLFKRDGTLISTYSAPGLSYPYYLMAKGQNDAGPYNITAAKRG